MRRVFRKISSVLKWTLPLVFAFAVGFLCFMEFGRPLFVSDLHFNQFVSEIKEAPDLSNRVYQVYEKMYPSTFNGGFWSYAIAHEFDTDSKRKCPCRYSSNMKYHEINDSYQRYDLLVPDILALEIEDKVSNMECMNHWLNNFDFLYSNIGIRQASKYYYGKELPELSDEELVELLLMTKNPTIYNPKRNKMKLTKLREETMSNW